MMLLFVYFHSRLFICNDCNDNDESSKATFNLRLLKVTFCIPDYRECHEV